MTPIQRKQIRAKYEEMDRIKKNKRNGIVVKMPKNKRNKKTA